MQDLGTKYMANKILFIGVGGAGVKAVDKIDFSNAKKIFIDEDCQSLHGLKSEGAKIEMNHYPSWPSKHNNPNISRDKANCKEDEIRKIITEVSGTV